ncbi:54S ribosomal protein L33, mitochondrial [[Candida] anglica]
MSAPAKTMFYKIIQKKSTIGMPPWVRRNIQLLGLRKRLDVSYQRVSPSTAHRIAAVKEMVEIELVDQPKTREQVANERKPSPGFVLLKSN